MQKIAEKLGRNPKSLEMTLIRKRGTSSTIDSTGMITAGELAKVMGVDRNTVIGWTSRHGLPFKKKVTRYKKTFTFIDINEFWAWAELNRQRIDFSKLVRNSLPPEPDWVQAERKNKKANNYRSWTVLEEEQLIQLASSGLPLKSIAEILNRSHGSVEKKYNRLLTLNNERCKLMSDRINS
ncbi:helix-turn-helix domain-containing protein [Bacillus sp. T33-2]|uniref:helix-turn-helix domain-containing protein n=1 Tax=Bacillus sp. T33-2 TaxID=2054168 RepID=UPI002155CC47|nr:helix-turn-helix domain-containing protein [Bacillus sp. T33-2]